MDNLIGILFGVAAMFCWGMADFFAALALKDRANNKQLYFWTQLVGLLPMLVLAYFFIRPVDLVLATIVLVLSSGFLTLIEYLFLYKSLQVGTVSLVSPLCATYPVITVVLSIVMLGEKPNFLQLLAVVLMIMGTIATAIDFSEIKKSKINLATKGLGYAAISVVSSGILFVVLGLLVKELGWFAPIFFMKLLVVIYLGLYFGIKGERVILPARRLAGIIVAVAVLEAAAFLSYGLGAEVLLNSLVVPISSTYPLVTILLASIFLREKITATQYFGIALIIGGITLAAAI